MVLLMLLMCSGLADAEGIIAGKQGHLDLKKGKVGLKKKLKKVTSPQWDSGDWKEDEWVEDDWKGDWKGDPWSPPEWYFS